MSRHHLFGLFAVLCCACGGGLTSTGYRHPSLDYHVPRGEAEAQVDGFLSPAWRTYSAPVMDLYLEQVSANGVLWIQTTPITPEFENADASALLQRFAASIRAPRWWVRLDRDATWVQRSVTILQETPVLLHGQQGVAAILDVGGNQRRGRATRVAVVLLLPNLRHLVPRGEGVDPRPVLMVVGYANDSSAFVASLEDFEQLLTSIEFPASALVTAASEPLSPELAPLDAAEGGADVH